MMFGHINIEYIALHAPSVHDAKLVALAIAPALGIAPQ
jgi:hypothetical protein